MSKDVWFTSGITTAEWINSGKRLDWQDQSTGGDTVDGNTKSSSDPAYAHGLYLPNQSLGDIQSYFSDTHIIGALGEATVSHVAPMAFDGEIVEDDWSSGDWQMRKEWSSDTRDHEARNDALLSSMDANDLHAFQNGVEPLQKTRISYKGQVGDDFFHVTGDGRTAPTGYNDIAMNKAYGAEITPDGDGATVIYGTGLTDIVNVHGGDVLHSIVSLDLGDGHDRVVADDIAGSFDLSGRLTSVEDISLTTSGAFDVTLDHAEFDALHLTIASDPTNTTLRLSEPGSYSFYSSQSYAANLYGSSGDDNFSFHQSGAVFMNLGGGNDVVTGATSIYHSFTILGGDGNDVINTTGDFKLLDGGAGDDQISGSATLMSGDDGNDSLTGVGVLDGGAGQDHLGLGDDTTVLFDRASDSSAKAPDLIDYFSGVESGNHGDLLDLRELAPTGTSPYAGLHFGTDHFTDSAGEIIQTVSAGMTLLEVDLDGDGRGDLAVDFSGAPTIAAGDILNIIRGSDHGDHISAGASRDTIYGYGGNDVIDGGDGNDIIDGGDGNNTLTGGAGDDVLSTGAGKSMLTGGDGNDILNGGTGSDVLEGNGGNDVLRGGDGNDTLIGGLGYDQLFGSAGKDTFVFRTVDSSVKGPGADVIGDFSHADGDKIDLSGIDADITKPGDQAFHFTGTGFDGTPGALRFDGGHVLQGDINGDGRPDLVINVYPYGLHLIANDFVL